MTRDFNKERRNDSRPPFRNSSPNSNNRDERTPRPSRPRLNREVVDRAWESGAPQRHADYRPRDNNRQGGQNGNFSRSSQGGSYGNSSRGPQRGQHGNSPRSSQGGPYSNSPRGTYNSYDNKPRMNNQFSESDNGPRRDRNDRSFQERHQGAYQDRRNSRDSRGNQRDGYRDNRYDSSSHSFHQERRPNSSSSSSYGNDGPRFNHRDDYRGHDERNTYSGPQGHNGPRNYSNRPYQGRDQSRNDRPYERRDNDYRPPWQQEQPAPRQHSSEGPRAKFEGDYESYNERRERDERPSRPPRSNERPFRGTPNTHERRDTRDTHGQYNDKPRERHVTPLPDGRVIKGSRPEQRRNARFWTDVSQETDELMNQVSPVEQKNGKKPATTREEFSEQPETTELSGDSELSELPGTSEAQEISEMPEGNLEISSTTLDTENNEQEEHPASSASNETELEATREAIRRRTRAASAVVREKKEKSVRSASDSTNMKPSRRGFKWPTP